MGLIAVDIERHIETSSRKQIDIERHIATSSRCIYIERHIKILGIIRNLEDICSDLKVLQEKLEEQNRAAAAAAAARQELDEVKKENRKLKRENQQLRGARPATATRVTKSESLECSGYFNCKTLSLVTFWGLSL